jgi:hypothetical protein
MARTTTPLEATQRPSCEEFGGHRSVRSVPFASKGCRKENSGDQPESCYGNGLALQGLMTAAPTIRRLSRSRRAETISSKA